MNIKKNKRAIPPEVKAKCVKMHMSGITAREIYEKCYKKHSNAAFSTFHRNLRKWKNKTLENDETLEAGNLGFNFPAHATTVQVDKHNNIVQAWIKGKAENNIYKELIEHVQALPPLKLEIPEIEKHADYMLEIPLFDLHFGIAEFKDYQNVLVEAIKVISDKNYKEINFIVGQDLFHANDFKSQTANGTIVETVDICKAWEDARKFYCKLIKVALKHSRNVSVIYSKGNHDEALAWCFVQMLKAQFKEITVDDAVIDRKLLTFGKNFIGITHGDMSRTRANRLPSMFIVEFPEEFAASNVREIHAGHLHSESQKDDYGVMMRRLSSGNITDDWHRQQGFVGAHKRFTLFKWSLEKLAAIYYL